MWSYALRRVLMTIPTLLLVITVCYLMLHATPGGPFDTERKVSAAVMANLQAKYHLQQHIGVVFLKAKERDPNLLALLADLQKAKPASSKGVYLKRVTLSSTMGPGVQVENSSLG